MTLTDQECTSEKPGHALPSRRRIVLALCGVTFVSEPDPRPLLDRVSLELHEGELLMLHLDRSQHPREWISMIQGLQFPRSGEVLFQGADWAGSDFDRHFRMRGRIGRVFEDQGWVANLNMAENLRLASEHHGRNPESISEQMASLADAFAVDWHSRERPAFVEPSRLQRYQWVRAMVGRPALLLLERPMQSVAATWLPKLVEAVDQLRKQGTAVLWLAGNLTDANERFSESIVHRRLRDGALQSIPGGGTVPPRKDVQ